MSGRLQIVAAALAVSSAFAPCAYAGLAVPAPQRGTSMDWFIHSLDESRAPAATDISGGIFRPTFVQGFTAGTTVRNRQWSASLFVSRATQMGFADDATARLATAPVVNATVSRLLAGSLRLSLDLFNLLDRSPASADYFAASQLWQPMALSDTYLFHPGEPRGVRLRLRKTF